MLLHYAQPRAHTEISLKYVRFITRISTVNLVIMAIQTDFGGVLVSTRITKPKVHAEKHNNSRNIEVV